MTTTDNSVFIDSIRVPKGTRTPGDIQSLIDLVAKYLQIKGIDNYSQILVGSSTPEVDNEDAIWLETDGANEPQALRVWNGSSWSVLEFRIPMGSSDDRPENPQPGDKFYDTTIEQELIFTAGAWRTSWGGKGQRIFVSAGSPEEALRLYPGWAVDNEAQGMFLRGANAQTGSETTGGSAEVTLTEANIPPHRHEDIELEVAAWGDSQPFGDTVGVKTPHTEHGVRTMNLSRTGVTGEGKSFEVTPPYYTLWVLKRL